MEIQEILTQHETRMDKTIDALKHEFASIRTGRASTSLLDKVMVDYYGTPTPVNQVANVQAPEPRLILVKPWERNMIGPIEKAVLQSDLGLNPSNDGETIRLAIPQLTEERRKELVKIVHKKAEEAKVAVRNIRRDAIETYRAFHKKKELTDDDMADFEVKIQKITDGYIAETDKLAGSKEKELMEI